MKEEDLPFSPFFFFFFFACFGRGKGHNYALPFARLLGIPPPPSSCLCHMHYRYYMRPSVPPSPLSVPCLFAKPCLTKGEFGLCSSTLFWTRSFSSSAKPQATYSQGYSQGDVAKGVARRAGGGETCEPHTKSQGGTLMI